MDLTTAHRTAPAADADGGTCAEPPGRGSVAAPDGAVGRVVRACRAMVEAGGPLPAAALETVAGCSSRQLARDFTAVVGVPPRTFGSAVRTGEARRLLREHGQVTDAVFAAGYGSTRGFYEGTGPTLGMAPHRYAAGGAGELLRWTAVDTVLGTVVAVAGDRGLTAVRIGTDRDALLEEVHRELPRARLERDDEGLAGLADGLQLLAAGGTPSAPLPVDLRGTAFQARVWDALLRIPAGATRTYTELAAAVGAPTAVRAVASACARNPVALVVPCHRVIRGDGTLGGYRWGLAVKQELLDRERGAATGAAPATAAAGAGLGPAS